MPAARPGSHGKGVQRTPVALQLWPAPQPRTPPVSLRGQLATTATAATRATAATATAARTATTAGTTARATTAAAAPARKFLTQVGEIFDLERFALELRQLTPEGARDHSLFSFWCDGDVAARRFPVVQPDTARAASLRRPARSVNSARLPTRSEPAERLLPIHPYPEDGGSGSVVEAVSTEQSLEMRSYRPLRYPELAGDFFIGQARRDPVQDLRLAGGHPSGRRALGGFCPNDRYTPGQGETILEPMADGGRVAGPYRDAVTLPSTHG